MKPDPKFPDRPTHPDFDLLSKIAIELDETTTSSFDEITKSVVDPASLMYLCNGRAEQAASLIDQVGVHPDDLAKAAMMAGVFEGFLLGYKFARQSVVQVEDEWIAPDGSHRTKE